MKNQINMSDQNTQQIEQNSVSQPVTTSGKPKLYYLMIGGVVLFCLVVFGFGGYYLGKQSSDRNQLSDSRYIQTPSPTPITPADPTTNWKTYNNDDLGFELKYPASVQIDKELNDQYNRATIFKGGGIHFEVMLRKITGDITLDKYFFMDSPIVRKATLGNIPANVYELPNGYCDGPSCSEPYIAYVAKYGSDLYHLSFFGDIKMSDEENQILSAFKFKDKQVSETNPPVATQNYARPASWKSVNIANHGISTCLPPKWEMDEWGHTVFNRDPAYKPDVLWINKFDYKGGSRRDEYINMKVQYEYEPDELKNETKVTEVTINGQSILMIAIPSFPETLVFVLNNKLYEVQLASWNLVNDSQSAFLKDVYTVVGCVKPL